MTSPTPWVIFTSEFESDKIDNKAIFDATGTNISRYDNNFETDDAERIVKLINTFSAIEDIETWFENAQHALEVYETTQYGLRLLVDIAQSGQTLNLPDIVMGLEELLDDQDFLIVNESLETRRIAMENALPYPEKRDQS